MSNFINNTNVVVQTSGNPFLNMFEGGSRENRSDASPKGAHRMGTNHSPENK